jgi:hypothetical protein
VRLIYQTLAASPGALAATDLAIAGAARDQALASALFLSDPSADVVADMSGHAFNPSTVFKLKQNLWHAGLLATKAHASAGSRGADYIPSNDVWALEATLNAASLVDGN